MCEPLGIFKPLIIIQVQLSLTVVRFKCDLGVNRFAFERVIKRLESQEHEETNFFSNIIYLCLNCIIFEFFLAQL